MPSLKTARQRMDKALESVRRDFSTVRTGKASPAILDTVRVEAYGSQMPLNQLATVSVPEARMLIIQPFDQSMMGAIEKAIQTADLGLNPANDGRVIRVPVPALTEERRKEFVRVLHKMGEDGRVSVRQARKDANDEIKQRQKDGELSVDEARRDQDQVQKLTDDYVSKIDELLQHKEVEVMEV
jgi:ribosome recycling factor